MEDIAIIGFGLRFPGKANTPEGLWEVMAGGESQWSEFPEDRLNIDGYFHPSGNRQGSISFRGAHFLKDDVSLFDAPFFSVPADDAKAIDPQQRILLEVSYEALESAGLRKEDLDGSDTAVYVGSFVKDYEQICLRDPDWQPQYAATGNGIAIMSNRISYSFNMHGPSMTVDTGCSGSLVSVHLAAQSLRNRESKVAIAAGAGLILTPNSIMPMTALNFLSPDGKCFTFDARANGYGRGEGIGVVVMKRLEDALRDNDPIRSVIRATSVNQDGKTTGITLPSKEAQVANIRSVYASANLDFNQTGYVECHGTGTQAGDWRELKAVSETIASVRTTDNPIYVGSVKPNIGHLEGAAGVAGLIKAVLMLEKGQIPPNTNFENGNPDIDFEEWKVKVPREVTPWPVSGVKRISVNCFGFGGTNAHVIVDESPKPKAPPGQPAQNTALPALKEAAVVDSVPDVDHALPESVLDAIEEIQETISIEVEPTQIPGVAMVDVVQEELQTNVELPVATPEQSSTESPRVNRLFCFSSNHKNGLLETLTAHADHMLANTSADNFLEDLSYTLNCRRSNLDWRAHFVASTTYGLRQRLLSYTSKAAKSVPFSSTPRICFTFCGQGAQWARMGTTLQQYAPFWDSIIAAGVYFKVVLAAPFDLIDELLRDEAESRLSEPHISQPATTAVQVALVELYQALGVTADVVLGHSSGEIAAAFAAGAISRESAWKIAYQRGAHVKNLAEESPQPGAMVAVTASIDEVTSLIEESDAKVYAACINSSNSVTVSGAKSDVEEFANLLNSRKIFNRILAVDAAYHSPYMQAAADGYQASLADLPAPEETTTKFISSMKGSTVSSTDLSASYWIENLVSPVCYADAVTFASNLPRGDRPDILIEMSPSSVLRNPTLEAFSENKKPIYVSSMRRKRDCAKSLLESVGQLWAAGVQVDMKQLAHVSSPNTRPQCLTNLPGYRWNHSKSYWHESHLSLTNRFREFGRHDLIGAPTADSVPFEPRWRGFLRVDENPWIKDHRVQNLTIYPAAGMIAMVLEAASQVCAHESDVLGYEITNMRIEQALIVPETEHGLEYAFNMKQLGGSVTKKGSFEFCIYSKGLDMAWSRHASGQLVIQKDEPVRNPRTGGIIKKKKDPTSPADVFASKREKAAASCTRAVDTRQVYEKLAALDLNYGPLFRNMTDLKAGDDNTCVATIAVPDTKSVMPAQYEYPHLIHPATLDSLFQTLLAIQPTPKVPTHFEKIVVSPKGTTPSLPIDTYGSVELVSDREVRADIHAGDSSGFQISITGLTLSAFEKRTDTFISNRHNLCSTIDWKPDVALIKNMSAIDMIMHQLFKKPALSVLQIGGNAAFAISLLHVGSFFVSKPFMMRYTVVDTHDIFASGMIETVKGAEERRKSNMMGRSEMHKCIEHLKCIEEATGSYDLTLVFKPDGLVLRETRYGTVMYQKPIPGVDTKVSPTDEDIDTPVATPTVSMAGPIQHVWWYLSDASDLLEAVYLVDREMLATTARASLFEVRREHNYSSDPVFLLMPSSCDLAVKTLASSLAAYLTSTINVQVTSVTISDLQQDTLRDKNVISLLELADNHSRHETIFHWDEHSFQTFQRTANTCKRLLCITRDTQINVTNPQSAALSGLTRTLRSENPRLQIATLDLSGESITAQTAHETVGRVWQQLADSLGALPTEFEYAERDGTINIPRLQLTGALNGIIEKPGDRYDKTWIDFEQRGTNNETYLDGKTFKTRPRGVPGDNEVQIGFEETMLFGTRDNYKGGADLHGKVVAVGSAVTRFKPDDHVTALVPHAETVSSIACVDELLVVPFNEHFIPTLHVSAYYGLITRARLHENASEVVLVHGGTMPHGKAAIQILLAHGVKPFATLLADDTEEQRGKLQALGLPAENIISLDGNLPSVDVLYDACGIDTPLQHLKKTGTLLRVDNTPLTTAVETVITINLAQLAADSPDKLSSIFQETSLLPPSNPKIFTPRLYPAWPICKITFGLPDLNPRTPIKLLPPKNEVKVSKRRTVRPLTETIKPDMTYLLVGGLGGLGRKIADLLVSNGATHLVFLSRSSIPSPTRQAWLDSLPVTKTILGIDISNLASLSAALSSISPPISAVFHCAAIIDDAIFDNMTYSSWSSAITPKLASWNVVQACPSSAAHIFLSSSAGIIGSRAQSNYAAGNTFLDALAQYCRGRKQHAVSLDLGPIVGAGMLVENEDTLRALRSSGFIEIHYDDFLTVLRHAIQGESFPKRPLPAQIVLGVGTGGLLLQNNPADPYWSATAIYAGISAEDLTKETYARGDAQQDKSAKLDLGSAMDDAEAVEIVCGGLRAMMARAMSMPEEDIDVGRAPKAYGVDSLVAVGIRNWIVVSCEVDVSVFELLSDATIFEVAEGVISKLNEQRLVAEGKQ